MAPKIDNGNKFGFFGHVFSVDKEKMKLFLTKRNPDSIQGSVKIEVRGDCTKGLTPRSHGLDLNGHFVDLRLCLPWSSFAVLREMWFFYEQDVFNKSNHSWPQDETTSGQQHM